MPWLDALVESVGVVAIVGVDELVFLNSLAFETLKFSTSLPTIWSIFSY